MIAPLVFSSMIGDGDFLELLLVAQNTTKIFNICNMDASIINLNKTNNIIKNVYLIPTEKNKSY